MKHVSFTENLNKNCKKAKVISIFFQLYVGKSNSAGKQQVAIYYQQNALFLLKIEGGSLALKNLKKREKKSRKILKGGPLVSPTFANKKLLV